METNLFWNPSNFRIGKCYNRFLNPYVLEINRFMEPIDHQSISRTSLVAILVNVSCHSYWRKNKRRFFLDYHHWGCVQWDLSFLLQYMVGLAWRKKREMVRQRQKDEEKDKDKEIKDNKDYKQWPIKNNVFCIRWWKQLMVVLGDIR